ncbi:MAG: DUF507 family protein [Myxococcota bacterium]
MRLYRAKVPDIASEVIKRLTDAQAIEVDSFNRSEAEKDLVAIMENYLRENRRIREEVHDFMERNSIQYIEFGKQLNRRAKRRNHPLGEQVEVFLANQFINNFFNSPFYDEVFVTDHELRKSIVDILREFHVDEAVLHQIARQRLSNMSEDDAGYHIRYEEELKKIRIEHGLIRERSGRGPQ